MREALFIKENRDKWQRIDAQNKDKNVSAETLAENFIEITDDLSYARTFYPYSQTKNYLNQVAGRYFIDISRYKKYKKNRFVHFWKIELPETMYRCRRQMLYSFLFSTLSVLLGIFSQHQENDFANIILGDRYVEMTLKSIDNGDPMAVYKTMEEGPMFFIIAGNNIKVAIGVFIAGIFLSVITVYILVTNGVTLGVFQYFFWQQGLLGTSMLSIWLHGTLEISAIIIAGGAGLVLGNSILFPGTYKRSDSLRRAVKDALKIIVGLVPVFIVAAFIESYMTRLTEMPISFNITIIGLSALFIIWYFIYYPYKVNKKRDESFIED